MQFFFSTLVVLTSLFFAPDLRAANDCDCPPVECGPCKDQVNIEFYTEKCNAGKKVKSCKRPICSDKDPLPQACTASATSETPAPSATSTERIETTKAAQKPVGTMVVAVGECSVTRRDEDKVRCKTALKVFEGDILETGSNGKLVVKLNNDNTVNLVPNSKAIVEFHEEGDSIHKTLINLMYGTIRSGVKKAPKDAKNDFKVKTPSAVAGVRGTDFVTSYTEQVGITKVETLTGLVELSSLSGQQKVDVPKGKYASYVVPSRPRNDIQDEDIARYLDRGHMTEALDLSQQEIARIEDETYSGNKEKIVAAEKTPICAEPVAFLNQCFWKVEQSGRCIRKRCNANGNWAEETRMPSSASENCDNQKATVAPCDY